ncbi:MAG: nucleotidyl transferase AbiEii/AbiGii toxin family protein [Planctomycetes bacterium]|nr:nucleotidyl transferase AbiEii/AbiGii toxin family protein [Planctomycetota bacterium]
MERFLYRLSESRQAGDFVLKGALMFRVWQVPVSRPTMDIDLLGRFKNDIEGICAVVRNACGQDVEADGMTFDAAGVKGARIADDVEYEGVRVSFRGNLGNARVFLQVDVGFGDTVTPAARMVEYPALLDFPPPRLRGYSRESTLAEKFHAMVKHDLLNSRMKDFYDVWLLSHQFDFDGRTLSAAVKRTFANRQTEIPARPVAFGETFSKDPAKAVLWKTFIRKSGLDTAPQPFDEVIALVVQFLGPMAETLAQGVSFEKDWKAGGPWTT